MKTLSIKNPWAALIALGFKDVENRSWYTNYRGKILIHSSSKPDSRFTKMSDINKLNLLSESQKIQLLHNTMNSAIIGEVFIYDCINNSNSAWAEPDQFHWILKEPKLYKHPIFNVKGSLSFWNYDIPEIYICESHTEIIECPLCMKQQEATVNHTTPFYSYVHECEKCQYVIMESEWNKIEKPEGEASH